VISIVEAVKELDVALARNVALEVEAAEWKIRAKKAQAEVKDLREQLKFALSLSTELMQMVDKLKSDRNTWRAEGML